MAYKSEDQIEIKEDLPVLVAQGASTIRTANQYVLPNDGTYFINGQCQKPGWYRVDLQTDGDGVTGTPGWVCSYCGGMTVTSLGWRQVANAYTYMSRLMYLNANEHPGMTANWSGHSGAVLRYRIFKVA